MDHHDRKQIMETFLNILEGIADKEYQRRVWIRGEGPECDDFNETVNFFFDIGEGIFENYEGYDLSKTQQQLLDRFRHDFEAFVDDVDNHYYAEEFIDSPDWDEMIEKAKEVLRAFNYQKPANSE